MSNPIPPSCRVPVFSGNKAIHFAEKPVPDGISPTEATLLLDIMGTGGHAIERCKLMRPDIESLLVTGAGHGEGITLRISPDIIAPERSVVGSEYFRYNELAPNLKRLRQHRDYLTQIITHRLGVDRIQEAFEMFFLGGQTGKVIIEQ